MFKPKRQPKRPPHWLCKTCHLQFDIEEQVRLWPAADATGQIFIERIKPMLPLASLSPSIYVAGREFTKTKYSHRYVNKVHEKVFEERGEYIIPDTAISCEVKMQTADVSAADCGNKESGVDEMIAGRMLHDKLQHFGIREQKGDWDRLIMISGDGNNNGNSEGPSLRSSCMQMMTRGLKVHIVAWKNSVSKEYTDLSKQFPTIVSIEYLDDWFTK